jgi:hypothetical protein
VTKRRGNGWTRAAALGVAVALGSCTHVPLATMLRMRRFDPATADAAALRAAIRADADGEFLPLVEDLDLREFAPKGKDLRDALPPCR